MTTQPSARALWITAQNDVAITDTPIQTVPGSVAVRTLFTGISRGTERLVLQGRVPLEEYDTMRAPFQDGSFAFPVKYGYSAVGRVETGDRKGDIIFALFPHQSHFAVPDAAAIAVPPQVPPQRAILAANMETAMNITWDAQIGIGDRVVVIGCGVVGALVAYLAAQIPGADVTVTDIDPTKRALSDALGFGFAPRGDLADDADVVIHASATGAGLETAIGVAGVEARIIEASWYGTHRVEMPLGGRFHQRRLQLISSQVGRIPAQNAARWTYQRRLEKALTLLSDARLDALISGETPFDALADRYEEILMSPATLCHRVTYD